MVDLGGVGIGLKLLPMAKPTGNWLMRRFRPNTSPSALDEVTYDLAGKVTYTEDRSLNELQASHGLAIPICFDELVPGEAAGSGPASGALPTVASFYLGLGDLNRMLVMGAPGSGKTVLVLHLIIDLIAARKEHRDPVPVRFNASGWDGHSRLQDFLVDQLKTKYSLQRPVARALIDGRRIMPVIDGLDEMDIAGEVPLHGMGAVETLNQPFWKTYPLVVTCRKEAYETIQGHLDGAGIASSTHLNIKPLQSSDINNYVQGLVTNTGTTTSRAQALKSMSEQLENDPAGPLGLALQTPWMLSLALAYTEQPDPENIAKLIHATSHEKIVDQLFAAQIPTACAHQLGGVDQWSYSQADVQRWMRVFSAFVSQANDGQQRTEVSLDQLWPLAGKRRTVWVHRLLAGGVACLLVGLFIWVSVEPGIGMVTRLAFTLAIGSLAGLPVGVAVGMTTDVKANPSRVFFRVHQKNELKTRLAGALRAGLMPGLGLGAMSGLLFGLLSDPGLGIVSGLGIGLLVALVMGLMEGLFDIHPRFRTLQEAKHVIRDDMYAGLGYGLILGLAVSGMTWFVLGLMARLMYGTSSGLEADVVPNALILGVLASILMPLAYMGAAGRYICAVIIFRKTGLFSSQPAKFLDWSTRVGLLRVTGTSYQIRHETYGKWLLTNPIPEDH